MKSPLLKRHLEICLDKNETYQSLIDKIKLVFGFPNLFGNNINALIEGFFFLRYKEETFANFYLQDDEILILEIKGLSNVESNILHFLILAVESANQTLKDKNLMPSIYLSLT